MATSKLSNSALTVGEVLEFFAERSANESEQFEEEEERDVPEHAETLVLDSANDVLKTVTSVRMAREMADDDDDISEEAMQESITESVVDLIVALGTLKFELDIDIESAVEERIEFVKNLQQFEDAMREADDPQEKEKTMDEYMTDEIAEEFGLQTGERGAGRNVDNDDYNPNAVNRTYQ